MTLSPLFPEMRSRRVSRRDTWRLRRGPFRSEIEPSVGRPLGIFLDPFLVCVKCVLRNRTFRIAVARTRDSQMRVTIDTRGFSANRVHRRDWRMRALYARRAGKRERIIFLSLSVSSFFHSAKSLGVQYAALLSRRYATARAFLQAVIHRASMSEHLTRRKEFKFTFCKTY